MSHVTERGPVADVVAFGLATWPVWLLLLGGLGAGLVWLARKIRGRA